MNSNKPGLDFGPMEMSCNGTIILLSENAMKVNLTIRNLSGT